MSYNSRFTISLLVFALSNLLSLAAEEPKSAPADPQGLVFFEAKIRPVLVRHCYQCHSRHSKKSEGNLLLDSRESIRKGGDRGPAIVPGDTEKSVLLDAILHTDADFKMPPKKERLPKEVLNDFTAWIRMGAPDPREASEVEFSGAVDIAAGRKFWSYQKPVRPQIPQVEDESWSKQPSDLFILAQLEKNGLKPTTDAPPATLLRRLHFDLVGLPPSPTDVATFEKRIEGGGFEKAMEQEVDRLLISPQFGEHWGRHWLDVARFAESSGKEANMAFPYAWRYRDYVIDCINADRPWNQFLVEQIAGDLLPANDDHERARLLIATGFLALGPKNLDEADAEQFAADVIDEQIDTVTRAVIGSSVACARCHDHKFEPFSMRDYYALAGIFGSTKTYFGTAVTPVNRLAGDPLPLPLGADAAILHAGCTPAHVAHLKKQQAELTAEKNRGMTAAMEAIAKGEDSEKVFGLRDALRIFWTLGSVEGQLEKVDDQGKPLPLAMGVLDAQKIQDSPLHERGEVKKHGEIIPRALPRVFEVSADFTPNAKSSGRLELARWLTHPDHPLTARVLVNRVWRHLFSAGLVRTVDNFGFSGERPSHLELLDDLAIRFVQSGWSLKKLVRELVLSRAYRQDSTYRAAAFRIDPENRLLWRMSKRRLTAEEIRDAMLVTSGELKLNRPVGSLVGREIGDGPIALIGLNPKLPADLDDSIHRSVYLPVLRDRLPDVLELFDFAEPSLVTGDRETTNVPLQALYLMNSPFVKHQAKMLANRVYREVDTKQEPVRAFELCFGRAPDETEAALAKKFFTDVKADDEAARQERLAAYCQALLAAAEFRNLD